MRTTLALLLLLAVSLPASARGPVNPWFEIRTPHFVVLTDTSEKQARRVASQFERMRAVFHHVMPNASDDTGSPIVVLALKDRKDFQTLEPPAYLAKGQLDLAGLFLQAPDKNYILLRLDAEGEHPFSTVYHEYTHFMMRNASEWLPLWLNEGLAEFYQNTDIQEKDVLLGQPSPDDILYLRQNRLLPLTTLLKVDYSSPYYHEEQKGSVFYAESWALTHYLEITDRQKGTDRIQQYATLLIRKEDSVTAAQKAFGDLNQLQKSLDSYISQGQFMMFKMNTPITVDESAFQLRAISSTEADAVRADVLLYNGREKDAQALIDSVLRDDPTNALAHETMGYLKFREGDTAAARKWYDEAVHLNSQSYLANYYYAIMSMQSADSSNTADIESSLRATIKLNPSFAPAYDALAMQCSKDPAKAKEAHLLNLQAISLDPSKLEYRINAAAVLSNQQQYDNAILVLKEASRIAKNPEEAASVQSRIQQIEQYQAAVAQSQQVKGTTNIQASAQAPTTTVTDTRTMTITNSDGSKYVLKPASVENAPKHPTEAPTGPHHTARGILRSVQCSYPSILSLNLDQSGHATPISLYRNDFYQIDFSATNFTPAKDINPCTDIEGMKAMVEYAEVSDKSVAGQILTIVLTK